MREPGLEQFLGVGDPPLRLRAPDREHRLRDGGGLPGPELPRVERRQITAEEVVGVLQHPGHATGDVLLDLRAARFPIEAAHHAQKRRHPAFAVARRVRGQSRSGLLAEGSRARHTHQRRFQQDQRVNHLGMVDGPLEGDVRARGVTGHVDAPDGRCSWRLPG